MYALTVLVSILFLFQASFADLNTCNGFVEINHFANLSESYYWPSGWTDQQSSVPQFASEQNCSWKFNVPKGMYAYFGAEFTSYDSKTTLKLTDSLGKTFIFGNTSTQYPYFLVDPSFTVELDSTSIGYLGIRVAWFPIPQTLPLSYSVMPSDAPLVLNGDTFNNVTTIKALNRVSLVSIKPTQVHSNDVPTMRLSLVFDGPDTNSPFLGSLWQVFQSDNHLVSSGSQMTILTVWPGTNLGNIAIFQDSSNVQNVTSFKGINCYLNGQCDFALDARNGPAAAIRYYESPHYLYDYNFFNGSQVVVYSGVMDQKHEVITYQYANPSNLPQKFRSVLTVYQLDKGTANFSIDGTATNVRWDKMSNMRNDRTGTIASKNIGTLSPDQEFSETFTSVNYFPIQLTVKTPGLTGQASLMITVYQGPKIVASETYNSGNLPQTVNNYTGNKFTVEYMTKGVATTGCQIDFSFKKSSRTLSIFMALIVFVLNFNFDWV